MSVTYNTIWTIFRQQNSQYVAIYDCAPVTQAITVTSTHF